MWTMLSSPQLWQRTPTRLVVQGAQIVRQYHVRHTLEVNLLKAKKGLTDASFDLRRLMKEDKITWTGKERRVKPTEARVMQEEKYAYNVEKRARRKIIKYIMAQLDARKKGEY